MENNISAGSDIHASRTEEEVKQYTYASTQPPYIDPDTGKKKYLYIHWGSVDENLRFIPGAQFYQASPDERANPSN